MSDQLKIGQIPMLFIKKSLCFNTYVVHGLRGDKKKFDLNNAESKTIRLLRLNNNTWQFTMHNAVTIAFVAVLQGYKVESIHRKTSDTPGIRHIDDEMYSLRSKLHENE